MKWLSIIVGNAVDTWKTWALGALPAPTSPMEVQSALNRKLYFQWTVGQSEAGNLRLGNCSWKCKNMFSICSGWICRSETIDRKGGLYLLKKKKNSCKWIYTVQIPYYSRVNCVPIHKLLGLLCFLRLLFTGINTNFTYFIESVRPTISSQLRAFKVNRRTLT